MDDHRTDCASVGLRQTGHVLNLWIWNGVEIYSRLRDHGQCGGALRLGWKAVIVCGILLIMPLLGPEEPTARKGNNQDCRSNQDCHSQRNESYAAHRRLTFKGVQSIPRYSKDRRLDFYAHWTSTRYDIISTSFNYLIYLIKFFCQECQEKYRLS